MELKIKSPSLWHLCLYGVGQIKSDWSVGNEIDAVWQSASSELSARFEAGSLVSIVDLDSMQRSSNLSPSAINDILRYFYYFSAETDCLTSLYMVIKFHFNVIVKWSDREKYELLATCSMFIRRHNLREIEFTTTSIFFDALATILLSITDPFLYARLANLLFIDPDQLIDFRTKEEIFLPTLNKVFDKFQTDMYLMSLKEPDEAHSINAFYVFSACLLGDAIASLPKNRIHKVLQMNELRNVAEQHFVALTLDQKATQFSFYKLLLMHLNANYEASLIDKLNEISADYTKSDFKQAPLAYLRSSYLLWEYSHLTGHKNEDAIKVLSNNIISHLTKISSSDLNCIDKYNNDILCFCYAYVLACLDCNSELRKSVLIAASSIISNINSISNSDLYKLLNCKNVVKDNLAL